MDGTQRRELILKSLENTENPISANQFAKQLNVSRQIIVGDIALLRAQGHTIIATGKGYCFEDEPQAGIKRLIAVTHTPEQTQDELELLVNAGIQILDVIVEHPTYGEIKGNLNITTHDDIAAFIAQQPNMLSSLTGGIHLHTIVCRDQNHYQEAIDLLRKHHYLYENE